VLVRDPPGAVMLFQVEGRAHPIVETTSASGRPGAVDDAGSEGDPFADRDCEVLQVERDLVHKSLSRTCYP
jgi:hypothetical protein